jgi:hypothetical protein
MRMHEFPLWRIKIDAVSLTDQRVQLAPIHSSYDVGHWIDRNPRQCSGISGRGSAAGRNEHPELRDRCQQDKHRQEKDA